MSDEIKETINWLNQVIKENKESDVSLNACVVPFETLYKLQDYITNSQEENERLKKNQRYYKNGVFSLEYDKETMSDIIDEYKKDLLNIKEILYNDDLCHIEKLKEINKIVNKAIGDDEGC